MNNIEECAKSELDLFSVPPTQTSAIESSWDCITLILILKMLLKFDLI